MKDALFGEESGKLQFLKLPLLFFPTEEMEVHAGVFSGLPEAP